MSLRILLILLSIPSTTLAISPDALSYYEEGAVYYDNHQYEMAIRAFDIAITIHPDFAEAYTNRGIVYNDLGDKLKAIEDLKVGCQKGDRAGCISLYIIA